MGLLRCWSCFLGSSSKGLLCGTHGAGLRTHAVSQYPSRDRESENYLGSRTRDAVHDVHLKALKCSGHVIDAHMTSKFCKHRASAAARSVRNHGRKQRANVVEELCSYARNSALNDPAPIRPGSLLLNTTLRHVHNLLLKLIYHLARSSTSQDRPRHAWFSQQHRLFLMSSSLRSRVPSG